MNSTIVLLNLLLTLKSGICLNFYLQKSFLPTGEIINLTENKSLNHPLIYGAEFLSGGIGALIPHFGLYSLNDKKQWTNGPEPWMFGTGYALAMTLGTTGSTYLVGRLFNQNGNWKKAAMGAGIAGSFVSFIQYNYHRFGVEYCLLPAYGAIIGYNWDRSKSFRQAGIYTFEGIGGCLGLGISYLITGSYYGLSYEYNRPEDCLSLYTISNMFFTSTTTSITGKLFKEKGTWWKSAVGAGIGALISFSTFVYYESNPDIKPPPKIIVIPIVLLPVSGAVLGYNLH
jgi:hypothetical protein